MSTFIFNLMHIVQCIIHYYTGHICLVYTVIVFGELTKLFLKSSGVASQTAKMASFSFTGKPHAHCIHCTALTNVTRLPFTLDFLLASIVREFS